MNRLFVPKVFNTYADTFLMLGIARLLEYAEYPGQAVTVQLDDCTTHYALELDHSLDLAQVAQRKYSHPFELVRGAKTEWGKIPAIVGDRYFNTVEQSERRKLFRDAIYANQGKIPQDESAPAPPDARAQTGVFLTSQRCDRNHNSLWLESYHQRAHYGELLAAIFQALQQPDARRAFPLDAIQQQYEQTTGQTFPKPTGAVKIYLPNAVQGVNRPKADSNKVDSQKADWLTLWLIAGGFFEFAIAERVKIAEGTYDWRVVAVEPKAMQLDDYRRVLDDLRSRHPPSGGYGIARFDSELVLKLCQELLKYHPQQDQDDPQAWNYQPPEVLGLLHGTHFNSKGQVYGVKELFTLGLPGWIRPQDGQDLADYDTVIEEHLAVLRGFKVETGHSELLGAYRHFITSRDLRQFFPFAVLYADYVVHQLAKAIADAKTYPPHLFTVSGLNLMVKPDTQITEIVQNPSFQRIAKAINQATVYAGKIQTQAGQKELDWQRQYGLAQLLSSQASSKTEFISAIADFWGKYSHENMRLQEKYLTTGETLKRIQLSVDDLNGFLELLEIHPTSLVAHLLIAYGYARWSSKKTETEDP